MPSNITIKTQPAAYMPVYNIIEVCAIENDGVSLGQPNYRFVITVNITGHASASQTFNVPPEPDFNYGIQDFSRYLDQLIKEAIPEPTDAQIENSFFEGKPEFLIEYDISIVPGWNVAGIFTVNPDPVAAVTIEGLRAWDASFEEHDWTEQINLGTPFNTWLMSVANGVDGKFLTPFPNKKVRLEDLGWTYFIAGVFADINRMKVITFDDTGATIAQFNIAQPIPGAVPNEFLLRMASAPASLNMVPAIQFITGVQPVIDSAVFSYSIQLFNAGGAAVASELITMTIEEECRYEIFRIHFLNRLGGFDAYNFTFRSQRSEQVTRKTYTKQDNNLDVNGIRYDHKDNGTVDYFVKYKGAVKLRTEYLTNEELEWLKEMIENPTCYLEFTKADGNQDFKPVRILTGKWEQMDTEIDKLFRLDINIELAKESVRQRK